MSQTIEELKEQVSMCEAEVARVRERGLGNTAFRLALQTLYVAQAFLAIAELKAELDQTKAYWEERWSRRWEP